MLLRLVDTRFQDLFTPLAGVLFAFPSWYWSTIGRQVVFSLGRWSSQIPARFLGPRSTQVPLGRLALFRLRGYHPLWPDFPDGSARDKLCNFLGALPYPPSGPTTPNAQRRQAYMHSVWAVPRSLATTGGISFDFVSNGYLDVSVPRVRSTGL